MVPDFICRTRPDVLTRNNDPSRPVALTMGDPAGIGPDIALAAWTMRRKESLPPFFMIGDPDLFQARATLLGLEVPIQAIEHPGRNCGAFDDALPILPLRLASPVEPGAPKPEAAAAIIEAIETGVDLIYEGVASAVITNPINKALLLGTGFSHPGHTEFLGELARRHGGEAYPVMMLACEELRVIPATVHIPLRAVADTLNKALLVRTFEVAADALREWFGVKSPRIAVTGLNPHAGENGAIGREEIEIIAPAIEEARSKGFGHISGPYPADTIFQDRLRQDYDAVITMYHDQALVPIKTLAFDRAVNLTLGLPFIRTSPDHGTAYDLAGTGQANPRSLIEAIRLAASLAATAGARV